MNKDRGTEISITLTQLLQALAVDWENIAKDSAKKLATLLEDWDPSSDLVPIAMRGATATAGVHNPPGGPQRLGVIDGYIFAVGVFTPDDTPVYKLDLSLLPKPIKEDPDASSKPKH